MTERRVTMKQLSKNFEENKRLLDEVLEIGDSFDLIYRVMEVGGKKACFYFIDGFLKDDLMQKLMQYFMDLKEEDLGKDAHEMSKKNIPYGEVDLRTDLEEIKKDMLSGVPLLLVDGYDKVICIDCRTYPGRSVEEPEKDRTMRGSRDGFVETLVFNTALIRRRIRSPKLVMEMLTVGKSSKTDVVISYMHGRTDEKTLEEVRKRISSIHIDSLTMNQESLSECLCKHKWYNPFPKFKYSERPDAAAASILEGGIVILVDNSPSAMILPSSVFDIIEEADDYYFPPLTGSYLRLSRMISNMIAVLLTPLFLLFTMHPEWVPDWLSFILITDDVNVPIIFQFLILEFAIDGLRMAAVNTPDMLSLPLSVVAGIVLGDYTVSSGWFNSEVMLYMAFVVVSNYTQVNLELGYALKFMRIVLLVLTALFHGYGFAIGIIFIGFALITNKTIGGKGYLYPLIPFDGKQCLRRFFRISLPNAEK